MHLIVANDQQRTVTRTCNLRRVDHHADRCCIHNNIVVLLCQRIQQLPKPSGKQQRNRVGHGFTHRYDKRIGDVCLVDDILFFRDARQIMGQAVSFFTCLKLDSECTRDHTAAQVCIHKHHALAALDHFAHQVHADKALAL